MTSDIKNAYFAGFFDGEGSVGIYTVSNNKSGEKTYWSIKLAMKEYKASKSILSRIMLNKTYTHGSTINYANM